MRLRSRLLAAATTAAVLLARAAGASITVPLTLEALATQSDVIVAGRVVAMSSGVDPTVGGIYTDVTIRPSEVFKGDIGDGPLVIKQQGGIAGSRGVYVAGQATFADGERVLLFLGTRARDGSLFTIGLWQGKWTIEIDPATGRQRALKTEPHLRAVVARRYLADLRVDLARLLAAGSRTITPPSDPGESVHDDRQFAPFMLNDPPIRWSQPSVAVNVETGTQPGLPGGGLSEIAGAVAQWNAASSSLTLRNGTRLPPRCLDSSGTEILVTFNDPCGEISSDSSVIAVAAFGYVASDGQVVNGRVFYPIVDAVITTSANPSVRLTLTTSPCFQATIAHEIGHAIGLGHSPDPNALMYFEMNINACAARLPQLTPDDIAGLLTIYPSGTATGGPPGRPTVTSAVAAGGVLNVAWTPGSGATPTAHRLDFFAGSAPVASVNAGAAGTIAISIPPGTAGSFVVQVTAFNGAIAGPASPLFPFSIGGGTTGGCSAPPAEPVVTGAIVGGTATVTWQPVPGASSYIVSAGSSPGAANIAPASNVGLSTSVSASGLPVGFSAWVRIVAVNACGQSAPGDLFLF